MGFWSICSLSTCCCCRVTFKTNRSVVFSSCLSAWRSLSTFTESLSRKEGEANANFYRSIVLFLNVSFSAMVCDSSSLFCSFFLFFCFVLFSICLSFVRLLYISVAAQYTTTETERASSLFRLRWMARSPVSNHLFNRFRQLCAQRKTQLRWVYGPFYGICKSLGTHLSCFGFYL